MRQPNPKIAIVAIALSKIAKGHSKLVAKKVEYDSSYNYIPWKESHEYKEIISDILNSEDEIKTLAPELYEQITRTRTS